MGGLFSTTVRTPDIATAANSLKDASTILSNAINHFTDIWSVVADNIFTKIVKSIYHVCKTILLVVTKIVDAALQIAFWAFVICKHLIALLLLVVMFGGAYLFYDPIRKFISEQPSLETAVLGLAMFISVVFGLGSLVIEFYLSSIAKDAASYSNTQVTKPAKYSKRFFSIALFSTLIGILLRYTLKDIVKWTKSVENEHLLLGFVLIGIVFIVYSFLFDKKLIRNMKPLFSGVFRVFTQPNKYISFSTPNDLENWTNVITKIGCVLIIVISKNIELRNSPRE